ncbi:hypothetical protein KAX06_08135 [candidate division WOR-3 bacterium]|nr:hypothetical protein [candidate division WOR-3 bacterium]
MWSSFDERWRIADYVQLIAALLLAACGVIFGNRVWYAYFLTIISLMLILFIIINKFRVFSIKIHTNEDAAKKALSRIYDEAAKQGGELISTQINPKRSIPAQDMAIRYLTEVERPLEYKRFIFMEDLRLEDTWIRQIFNDLHEDVHISLYFIKRSLSVMTLLWFVIPRANLLLYKRGNHYICLLGLDRLRDEGPKHKTDHFVIEFHNKIVFLLLKRYFLQIASSPYVQTVESLPSYKESRKELVLKSEIFSVLSKLFTLSDLTDIFLHVGIFGKTALILNGLQRFEEWEEHESDIDVMIIVKHGTKTRAKEYLRNLFADNNNYAIDIVWGDDENYFYYFRNKDKITIDLEIHEQGDRYYLDHPLLGCSIFAYYYTLFTQHGLSLRDLILIPYGYSKRLQRLLLLLKDRKGLIDFEEKMREIPYQIDPRRVVAMCVKNLAWALSGKRPPTIDVALEFLKEFWSDISSSIRIKEIRKLLNRSIADMGSSYKRDRELAYTLIEDATRFCKKGLALSSPSNQTSPPLRE